MKKRRPPEKVETNSLCYYGCGRIASYKSVSNKFMCEDSSNKCQVNREKISKGLKKCVKEGRRKPHKDVYADLPLEVKDKIAWSRGKTHNEDSRIRVPPSKRFGSSLTGFHTEETKQKMSLARTLYLKNKDNRKNLGRHKKSWMEATFEEYLIKNDICGWVSEKHFWSENLRKNFYVDFIFEDHKLIIELDGTQHLKTKELDEIRDSWFESIGYKVIRIDVYEFKKRFFSDTGFLDILNFN
jgi:very-short-patch-repair endonuclease